MNQEPTLYDVDSIYMKVIRFSDKTICYLYLKTHSHCFPTLKEAQEYWYVTYQKGDK